ncbi:endonuclease [Pedobacter kyungheensis]|uniref:Endonuclease n=1 Tax=Pedobacter kyungheensis TaxID=1069985 RepID=A0A0C1DLN1_9SPHI|nr:very short patch repair endonuclease [Pedobacter kyungheensis]KIA94955.1 endonuclease [Pedobacter kyungheensis]
MPCKKYPEEQDAINVPRFEESAGFYTTSERSKLMSKIKSKNTKAEIILRKALWANGIRFRIHVKNMPGKPDIVINKYRLAIFVDGNFWHGFEWHKKKTTLKSNAQFWIPKIERNMQRDRKNQKQLEDVGYTVIRFWDHDIMKALTKCVNQVLLYIEAAKDRVIPELL